jgi:hypothetical protein
MEKQSTNYFVCTLGQAALLNAKSTHKFSTIDEFIDLQARRVPGLPAIGFLIPYPEEANEEWDEIVLCR